MTKYGITYKWNVMIECLLSSLIINNNVCTLHSALCIRSIRQNPLPDDKHRSMSGIYSGHLDQFSDDLIENNIVIIN